jgi:HK97 family phage major capsid protein
VKDLNTITKELAAKRDEMDAFMKSYRGEDGNGRPTDEQAVELRKRNDELTEMSKQREAIKAVEDIEAEHEAAIKAQRTPNRPNFGGAQEPESRGDAAASRKSLGELFIESDSYKRWNKGATNQYAHYDVPIKMAKAFKTTFDTAGATLTQYDRQPGFVYLGQQMLTVADLFARGETQSNTIRYPKEDTFTNAATAVAEGATKPEAAWDLSEVDAPVRKIAVTTKITEELLMDFTAVRDYINERLPFMVRQTEESELLTGSGSSPHLTGVLNTAGIQTQATSSDTNPDAIYKAIVKVRTVGFFEPDAVVIHPNNWTPIRLLKTTTGEYVWGSPSEAGPERIWGLLVDVTTGITANTGLVGAFKLGGQIFYREGMRIESTNSNEDDFKKNLIALRAEIREALAIYRPKAFCTVTSLGT